MNMLPTISTLIGLVYGALKAKKLGGKPMDQLQFAVGFGIAFFTIGMFLGLFIDNYIR